jgi:hypothetical protein
VSRCQKNKCEKHFCVCRFRKLKSTRKSPPPEVGARTFTGRSIVLLSGLVYSSSQSTECKFIFLRVVV